MRWWMEGRRGVQEKMLLTVGIWRVLCGRGPSSGAAEFSLNSKALLWWCRQMRVGKRDPLRSIMSSARKPSQRPPSRKKKILRLTEIMELTVSRLKGVLCYPTSSKLALEGASPAEPAQLWTLLLQ